MPSLFFGQSSNKVVRFRNPLDVFRHWNFLNEAREALNDPRRSRENYSELDFLNMVIRAVNMGELGFVVMLTSKNDKPLGFGVAFDAQDFNQQSCFYVWAVHTTGRCPTALRELLHAAEAHARILGHKSLKMASRRIGGGAFRLYEDHLGFRREFVAFTKEL